MGTCLEGCSAHSGAVGAQGASVGGRGQASPTWDTRTGEAPQSKPAEGEWLTSGGTVWIVSVSRFRGNIIPEVTQARMSAAFRMQTQDF